MIPRSLIPLLPLFFGCTPAPPDSASGGPDDSAPPDVERGEILSLACQACHTLGQGEGVLLGPNLYGVFGRVAAGSDGFEYSDALRDSGIVWNPELLDRWLADPGGFLPGNNMVFAGYRSAVDRRDLIAFLLHKTGGEIDRGR